MTRNSAYIANETDFIIAIQNAEMAVSGNESDRYNALHSINLHFYEDASVETLAAALTVLANIIDYTEDARLNRVGGPMHMLMKHLLTLVDTGLRRASTSEVELWDWDSMKQKFTSASRRERIGKYLEMFLQ